MEHFVELLKDQVQIAALSFMAIVYAVRIVWLHRFAAAKEITPARGNHRLGVSYAMAGIVMPWTMESYRKHPLRYIEFALFHIGVAVTITVTFVIPYWPALMTPTVVLACRILIAAGLLSGLSRLVRRIARPEIRLISSIDDYFSIIILNLYFISALFGIAGNSMWATIAYFGMTTFFLIYVPFSKISHYLYYPFNKYFVGKHFGHRGVYPKGYQQANFFGR